LNYKSASNHHHANYGIRTYFAARPVHATSRIAFWFLPRSITAMLAICESPEHLVTYLPSTESVRADTNPESVNG
jgi:hypothetical protein